jgi:hypothetical protein
MKELINKPYDLIAFLEVAKLRSYKWMKQNPEVIRRYTRRYYRMDFDTTALMNRIKTYKKYLKGKIK